MERAITLTLLCFLKIFTQMSFAQSEDYYRNIKNGVYHLKSTDSDFVTSDTICTQKSIDYTFSDYEYLVVKNGFLVLFKTNTPSSKADVAGVLTENSIARIIDKEYRAIYENFTDEQIITFEVWTKISLLYRLQDT